MSDLDRSILNILTAVGVICGIVVFAIMFAILSYFHITHAKKQHARHKRKSEPGTPVRSREPSLSESRHPQIPGIPSPTAKTPKWPSMSSQVTLQVPETRRPNNNANSNVRIALNGKELGSNTQANESAKLPSMYAVGSSVAAFKRLLNNRNRIPSTQDVNAYPMEEMELERWPSKLSVRHVIN